MASEHPGGYEWHLRYGKHTYNLRCDGRQDGARALLKIRLQSMPTCDIVSIRMTPELPPL